jgi:hypothetical protein
MAILSPEELQAHYRLAAGDILENVVVPFLGAGVSTCNRQPPNTEWRRGTREFLPTGAELSKHLAAAYTYVGDAGDLARVAEYVSLIGGPASLYRELKHIFDADYPPNDIHRFLAAIPSLTRLKAGASRCPLIVTTNYDDLVERAFQDVSEPYDLVTYIVDGEHRGKFRHTRDGHSHIVDVPNQYGDVTIGERTVILKIHGAFARTPLGAGPGVAKAPDALGCVITEDHYIDYLTRTELANLVPVHVAEHLSMCRFLFMGYGLRDWNLRVMLHRISSTNTLSYRSWAIQHAPSALDRKFWDRRSVDILEMDLAAYVTGLRLFFDSQPDVTHPAGTTDGLESHVR